SDVPGKPGSQDMLNISHLLLAVHLRLDEEALPIHNERPDRRDDTAEVMRWFWGNATVARRYPAYFQMSLDYNFQLWGRGNTSRAYNIHYILNEVFTVSNSPYPDINYFPLEIEGKTLRTNEDLQPILERWEKHTKQALESNI
ncbi:MAG TPA: hypothetical protein VMW10_05290, partial [Alphaproteobacteria bacterium]|nr:hypothetical protein [Alphaproteobacteria bacterium]